MIAELVSAAVLATRGTPLTITWAATFALAVPDHGRLEHGFDVATARRLVTAGWLRTAAWTAHAGVALALVAQSS